jgi:HD-GYP domain-containing protein (c-di-GMP phosphodiesterase class II)
MNCPACQAPNPPAATACGRCGRTLAKTLSRGTLVASRYEVLASIGRGGMGAVYKAHDRVLDEGVALKVLRPEIAADPEMTRRFQSEIKLARKVTHRNVCRIHEYGQDGDLAYISMELISGTDLKEVVRVQGGLMADGAFDVALEILAGLQAIHDVGIIHRDLKTQNILIDSRGLVRLLDFGIAKEGGSQLTATGMIVGTPEYMSPEQARGERIDQRSDIYAFGIVAYELFAGRVPFTGENAMAVLYQQVNEPPRLDDPAFPPAVVDVLRRALAKDPKQRYASVRELGEALRRAQAEYHGGPAATAPEESDARAPASAAGPLATASEAGPLVEAIDRVARALEEERSTPALLELVADAARELLGAEAARAVLLQSGGDSRFVESAGGSGADGLVGTHVAAGQGLIALALDTEKPLLLGRGSEHPRYHPPIDDLGASGPGLVCVPLVRGAVRGALLVAGREPAFSSRDLDLAARFGRHASLALEATARRERALDAFDHVAEVLVSFLERIDLRYPQHSRATAALGDALGPRFGLSETQQLQLHFAGLLHDVGKLRLEPALLQAQGALGDEQKRRLQEHVVLGVQLVAPLSPWPEMLEMIHAHHERWDGTGYPRGLQGDAIPLGARIVAVADAYDAMTALARKTPAEAFQALASSAGQFDPHVVEVFVAVHRDRQSRLGL